MLVNLKKWAFKSNRIRHLCSLVEGWHLTGKGTHLKLHKGPQCQAVRQQTWSRAIDYPPRGEKTSKAERLKCRKEGTLVCWLGKQRINAPFLLSDCVVFWDCSKQSWTPGQMLFSDESDDLYLVSGGQIIISWYWCTKVILAFFSWRDISWILFASFPIFLTHNSSWIIDRKSILVLFFFSSDTVSAVGANQ